MKRRLFLRGIMGMTYPTDEPFVNRPPRPLQAFLTLAMSHYRAPAMHGTDPSCSPAVHGRITAMGPIAEPFYIVPHSMLRDLLSGRNLLATAESTVQPTIYRPHPDSPLDNLPPPIFGPFSQPNIVQSASHPYLPSHTTPITSSAPSHSTYPDTPSPHIPSPVEANNLYGQSTPDGTFPYPHASPTIASDSHIGIPVPICPPCAHTPSSSSCLHPADPVLPTAHAPQEVRTPTETPVYPPLRAPAIPKEMW
ncbi:hypothetical protein C2E23DRAFT_197270 [Lenzites betulinus]|nr:hypothetical protein C2E23DRAFT_197270 [Lenzites betulinus]